MFDNHKIHKALLLSVIALLFTIASDVYARTERPLATDQKIRVTLGDSEADTTVGIFSGLRNDTLYLCHEGEISIDSAITIDGNIIVFPFPGAVYDGPTKTLTGANVTGDTITLSLDDIDYVGVTLFVGDDAFSQKFNAAMLHRRLKLSVIYPVQWQVALNRIERVEVWHKKKQGTVAAFAAGGVVIGGLIGWATYDSSDEDEFMYMWSQGANLVVGALYGLSGGFLIGSLAAGKNEWKPVPAERLKIGVGQVGVDAYGLSLAFRF